MRVGVGVIGLLGLEKNVLAFVVDGYLWPGHCVNRKRVRPTAFSLKYVGGGYRPRANRYRVTHAFRMSITSPCGQEGVFNKPWHANIFKKQVQTTCEFLKNGEIKKRGASGSASLAASAPGRRAADTLLHRIGCSRPLDDGDPMRSREHSIFGFRGRKRNWRTATARDGCFADTCRQYVFISFFHPRFVCPDHMPCTCALRPVVWFYP